MTWAYAFTAMTWACAFTTVARRAQPHCVAVARTVSASVSGAIMIIGE
ncbi:hypothetical protein [Streptomyces sp. NPDC056672]